VFERTATCPDCGLSYPDYQDWSHNNSVFRAFDVWAAHAYVWRSPAGAQALRVGQVSGGFFETLGVSPLLGRLFTPSDDTPAAPRSVVLPYGTWQHFFGGRADVLGESLTLNNEAYIVIGVLPREFEFTPRAAELWVTIHDPGPCEQDRACRPFSAVARLNEGVSVSAALANTRAIAAALPKQYPQSNLGQDAFVEPFRDYIIADARSILLILLSGAVLLLLIACLNVAGLFLVRSESRRREMAVRGALGASRTHLAYQLFFEAALLVAISVAAGIPASYGLVRLLAVHIPERVLRGMPYFQSIGFDHRVYIFVAAVSLLAVMVCTTASVSRLSFDDLHTGLANGARGSSTIWSRLGSHLIVVQLSVAVVLLAAAGLLGKSFYRITNVELNFNPDHVATLEVDANTDYEGPVRQLALLHSVLAAVKSVPGVESTATATSLPVTCNCDAAPYRVLGHPWNGEQQMALTRTVSSAYFTTLQIRLLSGRSFNERDDGKHPPAALINRTLAEQFFPGEDPVGRIAGDTALSPSSLHRVIGVIDDVREGGLDDPLRPAVYFSANQNPSNYFFLVARTTQDPAVAMPSLAAAVHKLDPGLGVRNEFTMVGHIHHGAASYLHSSSAWFTGGFAACALLVGVHRPLRRYSLLGKPAHL
jgi:macrolide transport system ATP-binding/permease protein